MLLHTVLSVYTIRYDDLPGFGGSYQHFPLDLFLSLLLHLVQILQELDLTSYILQQKQHIGLNLFNTKEKKREEIGDQNNCKPDPRFYPRRKNLLN